VEEDHRRDDRGEHELEDLEVLQKEHPHHPGIFRYPRPGEYVPEDEPDRQTEDDINCRHDRLPRPGRVSWRRRSPL